MLLAVAMAYARNPSSRTPVNTAAPPQHHQQDLRVPRDGKPLQVDSRAAAGVLVLLVLAAYLPGFDAGFIWDDDVHVTSSRPVVESSGLPSIWLKPGSVPQYYPLTHTSFWIEYRLWGSDPLGYHAVNILLHAVSAVVLWRVLAGLGVPGSWLAAALFAVHPVHAESVVWISERKSTLSGLFALASTWAWLGWWRSGAGRFRGRWWLAMLLFAGALLSKTVTVTLPAAWLVICWWRRGGIGRREWSSVLPMLVLALPMGLMTIWINLPHIAGGHLDLGLSAVDRLLVAGRALWFYAGKLFWPSELAFIYPRWSIDSTSFTAWVYPLGVVALAGLLWCQRSRFGRGPLAAVLLFAGTLVPALGFVVVYPMQFSFVADHFQYLASIPLLTAAAWLIVTRWYATHGGALVLVLVVLSFFHSRVFSDSLTLWSDTVSKNPTSALALTNLGNELQAVGSHESAERRYREAIRVDPEFSYAWVNLSVELQRRGQRDEALEAASRAVELAPWLPVARVNLALGLEERGRYDEAAQQLKTAVARDGDLFEAWVHLARIELIRKNQSGVERAIEELWRLDPRRARELYPSP
jgi:tetratricopeptide (TPR) repeat protein